MKVHLLAALLLASLPAFAESPMQRFEREQRSRDMRNEALEMNRRSAEKEQLDRIEALARQQNEVLAGQRNDPLTRLETAFYGGTLSLQSAVRQVERIPMQGG